MVTRLLDFSDCKYAMDVHELLAEELEFRFYGYNLDALWDNLTGMMYVPADITIIYQPRTKAAEAVRPEIEDIVRVLEDARDEYDEITLTVHMDPAK